jgi:ankyrin repeat protein
MFAARDTLSLCMNALINAHANVNAQDANGMTPLMAAATAGNYIGAQKLAYAGAILSAKNKSGEDACAIAQKNHHTEIADFITDVRQERGK